MEKYYILTLNSGQPIILYREEDKVYMYTTLSGRIRSQGIVFDEVLGELYVSSSSSHYVSYISTKGQVKLFVLEDMRFVEVLSLPTNSLSHHEVKQIQMTEFQGEMLLFYLIHHSDDSSNSLFFVRESSINRSALVTKEDYSYEQFGLVFLKNELILCMRSKENKKFFSLGADMTITEIEQINGSSQKNMNDEFKVLKEKLDARQKASDKLQETVALRDQELNQYKDLLAEKENALKNSNEKIYELKTEISGLKSTQKHITEQYNELADFAGQLQEELRKVRYL